MKVWSFLLSSATIALLGLPLTSSVAAQGESLDVTQTGMTQYRSGNYTGAIETWQQILQKTTDPGQQSKLLEQLARAYQKVGQSEAELTIWNQLITRYTTQQNAASLARILTEKAQALSRQGQSQNAMILLCDQAEIQRCSDKSAIGLARRVGDRRTEAAALGSLGEAYRLQGDYDQAITVLNLALTLATELNIPIFQASAQNSLGNTYRHRAATHYRKSDAFKTQDPIESEKIAAQGQADDRLAVESYRASLVRFQQMGDSVAVLQGFTNLIPIYQRLNDRTMMQQTWQQAYQLLQQLPASRATAYGAIELARVLQQPRGLTNPIGPRCWEGQAVTQAQSLLRNSQSIAMTIGDQRAQSFALGALGDLAECAGQWDTALNYSQQAILAAEQHSSDRDSLYLWEWQRGRILRRQGNPKEAIEAYTRSIAVLEQVRREMVQASRDVQFDFRETIDPIYRELVDIRLSQEGFGNLSMAVSKMKSDPKSNPKNENLKSTLETLDALKLAELQNYFGNNCVIEVVKNRIDERTQKNTAVITTVIGEERTAVIVSLPDGTRTFSWIPVKRSELEKTIEDYRIGLESFDVAAQGYDSTLAQKLYGWLVAPFERELAGVETLVFVQDGLLRSVPMSALHDGKQFLIQKHAIATAPSLSLVDADGIDRQDLNILALGLTQEATIGNRYFQPLKQVEGELRGLIQSFPRTTILLDKEFNRSRIKTALQNSRYSILHIATHGKFGIEAEDTFFVTGDADQAQQRFNLNELEQLMRRVSKNTEPLDLLVLTACETAIGDDRSALGLAGVAVQSGASSAIASLWAVNDSTTAQLSTSLYGQLANPQVSKAEALQAAQVKLIQRGGVTAHPYYWSAFVLVGNWL